MSENNDSERVLGGFSAGENGESDGVIHVESPPELLPVTESEDGFHGAEVSMPVETVSDREPSSLLVDYVDHNNKNMDDDSEQDKQDDVKASEDALKEDMFVDCPDELNLDNKEATEASDTPHRFEDNDDVSITHSNVSDGGAQVHSSKIPLDQQSTYEDTIGQLHAILYAKDQEIEYLSARADELSVSRDVIFSYLTSLQENFSPYLQVLPEIQLVVDRILASLGIELSEEPVTGKISQVEKGTSFLVQKYNWFLSEIYMLRQCLADLNPDFHVEDEMSIMVTARKELVEAKQKEVDLYSKLSHVEDECRQLAEQLEKQKEMANAEISKLRVELEQEKTKCVNTKEKLSMAVTKGKALVQQRDSLKQLLADKTGELEKCLLELQEKSSYLEAAKLRENEFVRTENLAASLQEALSESDIILSERDIILKNCEEIMSETLLAEEVQTLDIVDRLRWLVHERKNEQQSVAMEFQKLKDVLSSIDAPESALLSDLESRCSWLVESFRMAQDETVRLRDELAGTREAAEIEIGRLTTSLLSETQKNDYLQEELEDLSRKYESIVKKEHEVLMEKEKMINMLLEASEIAIDSREDDTSMIIDRCFAKIKEEARDSLQSSNVEAEIFEKIQSLLYVRNQELALYELITGEDILDRSEINRLLNELAIVSKELHELKDEKGSLQKDLERSEERAGLIREKLSMAVKKGKGLVQERENLRQLLDGKNAEIEKLKTELEKLESSSSDYRDQINLLSTDVSAMKQERDHFERFLVESNNLLQRVMDLIDGIPLPVNLVFEEPVEKVKCLAQYLAECEAAKARFEQELGKVDNEAHDLARKLAESNEIVKSLEDELSFADKNLSQLAEGKRETEIVKTNLEQELQKAIDEASDISSTRKSLEDALALAENNISVLLTEKEDAKVSRAATEKELQKVKEDLVVHSRKLDEAYSTIRSLEDTLSQLQATVSLITVENEKSLVVRVDLENEIKMLKEEADFHAGKLADASSAIKSLEDALSKAENNISNLVDEKLIAENEVSSLNSRLNECMQELAGTHGNMENRVLELSGHFKSLQLLLKDETLLSSLTRSFEKKLENLKDMDLLLNDIKDHFAEMDSEMLQTYPTTEEWESSPADVRTVVNFEMANGEVNEANAESITLWISKTVEGFHLRNKILANNFELFSSFMDEKVAALLEKFQATRDGVIAMVESMKSLKEQVINMEMDKQTQEGKIVMLENNIKILLSACDNATEELEFEVENNPVEIGSVPELGKLNGDSSKYVKTAEKLLYAAKNARSLNEKFYKEREVLANSIEGLQNKLEETRTNLKISEEERSLNQIKISKLETDLEESQDLCSKMMLKLDDFKEKEDEWKQREAELSSLYSISTKQEEAGEDILSASQMRSLFDKINGIETHLLDTEIEDKEGSDLPYLKKLFYIVDSFMRLQHEVNLFCDEKQKLHSTLSEQVLEIQHLKQEIEDYEKAKNELVETSLGLENIIQRLGGEELVGSQKSVDVNGQLMVLEKLAMAVILESENSKSKSQELSSKLLDAQTVVSELSVRIKLLEESNQNSASSSDTVMERGIFEAPSLPNRSEISEIEDVGPIGKKTIPPATSAAHARTLRKGSSDHLINIDLESDRLIKNQENDEDKGHLFKSLISSGLIPRQGKTIADRIDGIWVSGGRALMSRPRARLSLIAYWLLVHLWLLGSIF